MRKLSQGLLFRGWKCEQVDTGVVKGRTQVTPAAGNGIGCPDQGGSEHDGAPVLAGHEGRQAEADDAAAHYEGRRGVDQGHAKHSRGRQHEQEAHGEARAKLVGEGAQHQAGEDGARDLQAIKSVFGPSWRVDTPAWLPVLKAAHA